MEEQLTVQAPSVPIWNQAGPFANPSTQAAPLPFSPLSSTYQNSKQPQHQQQQSSSKIEPHQFAWVRADQAQRLDYCDAKPIVPRPSEQMQPVAQPLALSEAAGHAAVADVNTVKARTGSTGNANGRACPSLARLDELWQYLRWCDSDAGRFYAAQRVHLLLHNVGGGHISDIEKRAARLSCEQEEVFRRCKRLRVLEPASTNDATADATAAADPALTTRTLLQILSAFCTLIGAMVIAASLQAAAQIAQRAGSESDMDTEQCTADALRSITAASEQSGDGDESEQGVRCTVDVSAMSGPGCGPCKAFAGHNSAGDAQLDRRYEGGMAGIAADHGAIDSPDSLLPYADFSQDADGMVASASPCAVSFGVSTAWQNEPASSSLDAFQNRNKPGSQAGQCILEDRTASVVQPRAFGAISALKLSGQRT